MSVIDQVADGLTIFRKYAGADIGADHDIIYVWLREDLNDEDREKVVALDWFQPFEGDTTTWHRYV